MPASVTRRGFLRSVGLGITAAVVAPLAAVPPEMPDDGEDAPIIWFGRNVPYRVCTNRNICGPPLTLKDFEDFIEGQRHRPWNTENQ